MRKLIASFILVLGAAPVLLADGLEHNHHYAPEINLSTGIGALILIAGAVLISRGRHKIQS